MRVLSWNIRHGGGRRLSQIAESIRKYDPDIVVLIEFRRSATAPLVQELRACGWPHVIDSSPEGNANGVALLSRHRTVQRSMGEAESGRALAVDVTAHRVNVVAVYIPVFDPRRPDRKANYWDTLLQGLAAEIEGPALLIGDFNTGHHLRDEAGRTFRCADRFARLEQTGWTDLWRRHNEVAEFSWYSSPGRRGFRLDHAFASPSLVPHVTGCRYEHAEREAAVSDHSLLLVDIKD